MNISFSAEHEAFRDEVRRFLDSALTDELRDAQRFCPGIFLDYEHNIVWHRILYKQGWIAPGWPKEYGGTGWDLTQRYIWGNEATLAGAPSLAPMGLGMCGPMQKDPGWRPGQLCARIDDTRGLVRDPPGCSISSGTTDDDREPPGGRETPWPLRVCEA